MIDAMAQSRAPRGLLVAAIGAAILGVAVFEPWYGVSITPAGAAALQQRLTSEGQAFGNAEAQAIMSQAGARIQSMTGRQIVTLSAHQVLKDMSPLLLLLGAAALVISLLRLAGIVDAGGGWIAACGFVAALCILFRLFDPPNPAAGYLSLSLSWGGWLSLLGALAVALGGAWSPSATSLRAAALPS